MYYYLEIAENKDKLFDQNGIRDAERAFSIAEKLDDFYVKYKASVIQSSFYKNFGDYPRAIKILQKSVAYAKKMERVDIESIIYRHLGETYRAAQLYELSELYLLKSIAISKNLQESLNLAISYNRMAALYYEWTYNRRKEGKINSPDYIFIDKRNISLLISQLKKLDKYLFKADSLLVFQEPINSAQIKLSNLNISGAFDRINLNYKEAEKKLLESLEIGIRIGDNFETPMVMINLANMYFDLKQYKKVEQYSYKALKYAEEKNVRIFKVFAYDMLYQLYKKQNKPEKALYAFENFHRLRNILFNTELNIKLYSQESSYLKKQEIEKEKNRNAIITYQNIILGTFVISILVITLLFSLRNKQQKEINKKLSENNNLISLQKEKLEEANKSKDKLFSILAHDLRSPFLGLMGFTDILDEDYEKLSGDEKKDIIKEVRISVKRLFQHITNMLEWSRLQLNHKEFKPEKLDLFYAVENVINLFKGNAQQKNLVIINNIKLGSFVQADINMLNSIFHNLISNAIKYSFQNGIIEILSDESEDKYIVQISDNGIGIKQEDLTNLFSVDKTFSTTGTSGEKGTGLGLLICKELVNKNGGEIFVESKPGQGTRFTFNLKKWVSSEVSQLQA